MKRDKLARKNIRFFLIPFLVLTILFAFLAYNLTRTHVQETYKRIEQSAIGIADSYSSNLQTTSEASKIISDLLDEKILLVSESVLFMNSLESNIELEQLAEKFQVDQINLFNERGEVVHSNITEYIGWKALPDHPVFKFMISEKKTFVEDIRADTENGIQYKFGYVKRDDNTFVQIGVNADNVDDILKKFDVATLIDNISNRENVELVFFTDNDSQLVAGNNPEYAERFIQDDHFSDHIDLSYAQAERFKFEGRDILHVCTPVFFENNKIGTLTFVWSANIIDGEIINIIFNSLVQFIIVVFTIGIILNYAYRKSISNISIAYYDKLTGLPNREYLEEYLEQDFNDTGRKRRAVLLLNCTNFRTINTTYGFKYGNQILGQIANKIKEKIKPSDMLFRFGADRFALVIENYQSTDDLNNMALDLVSIFSKPFGSGSKHEDINGEVAVFELYDHYFSVDKILQSVSLALTYLKQESNEHVIFYDIEMEIQAQRQDIIEKAIKSLIQGNDGDSLYLEFQPKLDLKTKKITGFEALARMNIPNLGEIPPAEFISLAEKRMLMYDLGNLIMLKAFDFLILLRNSGFDNISLAVNISSIQILRNEFTEYVKGIVSSTGIRIESLEFEITESVLIDNFDLMNETLKEMKKFGISISLDDFGTGFSSFARLRDLNIDSIKIDKYFIDKISVTEEAGLISADIISMAHKIGLTVVAEGVENETQRTYLEKSNCDIIQGYLISRPLSADEAIKLL